MSLLVVGSVALDSVITPTARRDELLGGSASFFASVASMLVPVRLVAVVGEDFPEEHLSFLAERGVDLTGLQRVAGRTFRWTGRYLDNMVDRETIETQLNVFESFHPNLPLSYRESDYLFLGNIDPALQLDVLGQARQPKFVGLDTMNFWLRDGYLGTLKRVLERTSIIFLNDEEARLLSGQHNLVKAAAAIRLMGVEHVVVKRGDAGAMLFDEAGPFWVPAYPLPEVVDPTGAGDCFAGGVMGYLAHGGDLSQGGIRRAMVVGSAAASFAVEGFGVDRLRSVGRRELVSRCAELARLVRFDAISL